MSATAAALRRRQQGLRPRERRREEERRRREDREERLREEQRILRRQDRSFHDSHGVTAISHSQPIESNVTDLKSILDGDATPGHTALQDTLGLPDGFFDDVRDGAQSSTTPTDSPPDVAFINPPSSTNQGTPDHTQHHIYHNGDVSSEFQPCPTQNIVSDHPSVVVDVLEMKAFTREYVAPRPQPETRIRRKTLLARCAAFICCAPPEASGS